MSEIRTRGKNVGANRLLGKEVKLDYGAIGSQMSFLQGKILTIIDASFTDERQLKAVKDLVKAQFSEQLSWIGDICFPETNMVSKERVIAENGEEYVNNMVEEAEEIKS